MARPKTFDRAAMRTEKISLALTQADLEGLQALAQIQGVSVNELLNSCVAVLVKKNSNVIESFQAAQAKAKASLVLDIGGGDLDAQNS